MSISDGSKLGWRGYKIQQGILYPFSAMLTLGFFEGGNLLTTDIK